MEGFAEALVGCAAGDTTTVSVTFPVRPSGPGAALSGKQALFEVTVLNVKTKTLPKWDEDLAKRIRPDLTLELLEAEVRAAIEGDGIASTENARNDAIATALLEIVSMKKIPESLVDETTQVDLCGQLTIACALNFTNRAVLSKCFRTLKSRGLPKSR